MSQKSYINKFLSNSSQHNPTNQTHNQIHHGFLNAQSLRAILPRPRQRLPRRNHPPRHLPQNAPPCPNRAYATGPRKRSLPRRGPSTQTLFFPLPLDLLLICKKNHIRSKQGTPSPSCVPGMTRTSKKQRGSATSTAIASPS